MHTSPKPTRKALFAEANDALDSAERSWRRGNDEAVTVFLQDFADAATALYFAGVTTVVIARRCSIGPRGFRRSGTGPDVVARVDWFLGTLYSYTEALGDVIPTVPSKGWFETVNVA